jgi:hypothetical protein
MSNYYNRQWRLPNNENKDKQSNYSISFDGLAEITTGGISGISSNTTVSFWFNNSTAAGGQAPIIASLNYTSSIYENFAFRLQTTNILQAVLVKSGNYEVLQTSAIIDNAWYFVALTTSTSGSSVTATLYLNGTQVATNSGTDFSNLNDLQNGLTIGHWTATGNQNNFNGKIDAVAIYNYALSSSQITTLYGSSSTGIGNPMSLSPKPVAYYPLGDQDAFNGADYLVPNSSLKDYVFDFSSDLIDSNFSLTTGQTQFSASIWVKFTGSLGNDESLIANESSYAADGFAIFKNTSNQIVFKCEGASATGTTTIALNKWYLVTVTYNAGAMVLYVNGQQEATQTTATSITQPSTPKTRLGKYITGNVIPFTGELSNAQIFNTALPATGSNSIETLYNNGSPLTSMSGFTSLQAWYKLDSSEIYDSSNTQWQIANNVLSDKAYSFNGTNNIEITQNSSIQTSSFSIGFWVKGYPQSGKILFENGGANGFTIKTGTGSSTKRIYMTTGGSADGGTIGAFTGEWNFVFFTFDGTIRRSINGVYVSGGGGSTPSYDSSKGLFIGSDSSSSNGFVGEIAQVVYYDKRGPNDAAGVYGNLPANPPANPLSNYAVGGVYPALISWWKLNAASITDSQGSNTGTNNGATLIDTNIGRPSAIGGISSGMTQSALQQSDLSFTSGYSPYALAFDGTNDYITVGSLFGQVQDVFSVSAWVNFTSNPGYQMILSDNIWFANYTANNIGLDIKNSSGFFYDNSGGLSQGTNFVIPSDLRTNKWINVAFSYVGSSSGTTAVIKMYLNGTEMVSTTVTYSSGNANLQNASNVYLGSRSGASQFLNGSISNVSIWNYALSPSQIREIYNQGLPSNLNTFSGTAPVSWWQLGSNSSFNSTLNQWTCIDEKGTNTGESSQTFAEDAIVDGVGSYANGVGTSGLEVIGSAPFSDANSLSVNMDALDRTDDTPN